MSEWAYRKCECGERIHINTKCKCGGDPWHLKEQFQQKLKSIDEKLLTLRQQAEELQSERDAVAEHISLNFTKVSSHEPNKQSANSGQLQQHNVTINVSGLLVCDHCGKDKPADVNYCDCYEGVTWIAKQTNCR